MNFKKRFEYSIMHDLAATTPFHFIEINAVFTRCHSIDSVLSAIEMAIENGIELLEATAAHQTKDLPSHKEITDFKLFFDKEKCDAIRDVIKNSATSTDFAVEVLSDSNDVDRDANIIKAMSNLGMTEHAIKGVLKELNNQNNKHKNHESN